MLNNDVEIQHLISRREYDRADQLIRDKFKNDPGSADAYYLKAVLLYFQGKFGPAVDHLKKSLEVDPNHTDAAICLSVVLNDVGRYQEAKGVFEKANQSVSQKTTSADAGIDRKFAVKHLELADLYFRYRRYDEAIDEYGKAALLDPTSFEIRIRKAKANAKKGYLSRAIQELEQLKAEHPQYLPARIQLGLLHYSQGDVLDAELEWESILLSEPSNREARSYLEMAKKTRTHS